MNIIKSEKVKLKTKRTFLKQGTCSRTFFHILNREFGHPRPNEEIAVDPLAGGIVQHGYQCGMLWGASMAVGAEAYRRYKNQGQAIAVAIKATKVLMESFLTKTKSTECEEITNVDFKKKWGIARYFFTGKMYTCFSLASRWAPLALEVADKELSNGQVEPDTEAISCASEVVKKMGGTDEEIVMAAGFAGGLGLSGSGCGALAAAIWKTILELVKKDGWKYTISDPDSAKVIERFNQTTEYEMECSKICGKKFNSVEDHTEFIKSGGCGKLIEALANAKTKF
jgi:hypothetical protein